MSKLWRLLAIALLLAGLAPGVWWRNEPVPYSYDFVLRFEPLKLPPRAVLKRHLGPFRLEHAWSLEGKHALFGGFSGLIGLGDGQLAAFSDLGHMVRFTPPGRKGPEPLFAPVYRQPATAKRDRDIETATIDRATGTIWTGQEFSNSITRHRFASDGLLASTGNRAPRELRGWGSNSGPETMARLADGSFVLLREGFGYASDRERRPAVRFASDPVAPMRGERFTVIGPAYFSPTDMDQLPDGRVLVLYRRPVWPFPQRFAGRIAIGDPKAIAAGQEWRLRDVAKLSSNLPVDNFEGLAIEPRRDGRVTVWLISDDNLTAIQRTVLWELSVDPKQLPRINEKAREKPARRSGIQI